MAAIRAQFLGLHFKRLLFLLLRVSPYTFGRFIYIYTYINIYIHIYICIYMHPRPFTNSSSRSFKTLFLLGRFEVCGIFKWYVGKIH